MQLALELIVAMVGLGMEHAPLSGGLREISRLILGKLRWHESFSYSIGQDLISPDHDLATSEVEEVSYLQIDWSERIQYHLAMDAPLDSPDVAIPDGPIAELDRAVLAVLVEFSQLAVACQSVIYRLEVARVLLVDLYRLVVDGFANPLGDSTDMGVAD
jgi:hypothetical protein